MADRKTGTPTALARTPLALRRVVEASARREQYTLRDYAYTHALAFHPSGRWLVTACRSSLVVVDLTARKVEKLEAHTETLSSIAFDETGRRLVSVGWDGAACVWDFAARTFYRFEAAAGHRIHSVAITRDGRTAFMVGHEAVVSAFDLDTKRQILRGEGHRLYCSAVGLSPDESVVLSSDSAGELRIWDRTGTCLRTLGTRTADGNDAIPYWPVSIRFSKSGDRALLACRVGSAALLSMNTHRVERILDGGHTKCVTDAVYLETLGLIVTCSEDGCVSVWDPDSKDSDGLLLTLKAHTKTVLQLAVSPDGASLASFGSDGVLTLWDVNTLAMAARDPAKLLLIAKASCEACGGRLSYVDPKAAQIATEQLACQKCGAMYELAAVATKRAKPKRRAKSV